MLLRRVTVRPEHDPGSWYWQIPAVDQLRAEGLTLERGVTVLVGDNGSGKSTLVEALAAARRGRLTGAEVVMATHSPLLAAAPGARVLELGEDGSTARDRKDLELVRDRREFPAAPQRRLRHLEAP